MRILFMGGKRVGHGCLSFMLESGCDVVGVIVNSGDEDSKRWFPSTAELARGSDVPVFEWDNVNSDEAVETLKELSPDLIVLAYYDQILRRPLIELPTRYCLNVHMALSEEYRGCYPTTWALLNGESRTGITIHVVDEGIDTGPIIAQVEVPITNEDTGRSLYERCTDEAIQLFRTSWPHILDDSIQPRVQHGAGARYYRREFPSRELDFNCSGRNVYDQIRAHLFDPFPPPYLLIGDEKYEIRKVSDLQE